MEKVDVGNIFDYCEQIFKEEGEYIHNPVQLLGEYQAMLRPQI